MIRRHEIRLKVNGAEVGGEVEPRRTLADFLRENLGLTGTHLGCEHGVCGACTILLNGAAARSCLTFAVQANGREVRTVEDLGTPEAMSGLQESFKTHHGLQCGFCTPGFLMTLTEFLKDNPRPTREEIRAAISGNLCRCTGYAGIIDAVSAVVEASSETESSGG